MTVVEQECRPSHNRHHRLVDQSAHVSHMSDCLCGIHMVLSTAISLLLFSASPRFGNTIASMDILKEVISMVCWCVWNTLIKSDAASEKYVASFQITPCRCSLAHPCADICTLSSYEVSSKLAACGLRARTVPHGKTQIMIVAPVWHTQNQVGLPLMGAPSTFGWFTPPSVAARFLNPRWPRKPRDTVGVQDLLRGHVAFLQSSSADAWAKTMLHRCVCDMAVTGNAPRVVTI